MYFGRSQIHTPIPAAPESLGRLVDSIFGSRSTSATESRRDSPCATASRASETAPERIPDQLGIDQQIRRVIDAAQRHGDAARRATAELELLADTQGQLRAVETAARELQPAIAAMEEVYTALANSSTAWVDDLARQESEYKQSRHEHYAQLQQQMDRQYAELSQETAQRRAADASLGFQRDLERFQKSRPPTPRLGRQAGSRPDLGSVALATNWDADSQGFFSDDEIDSSASAADKPRPKLPGNAVAERKAPAPAPAAAPAAGKPETDAPAFDIIGDEDFP
ncbi:hypothetical protein EC988_000357 [Linderina pennispora]|nr:hypothetical protein EC988_000357 [Linderina pennispora]